MWLNCRVPAADMIKLLDVKAETEDKIEEDGAAPASASLKLECGKIALESRGGAKAQREAASGKTDTSRFLRL